MAKKQPDVVTTWEVQFGEENVIKGGIDDLTHLAIKDDEDEDVNLVEIAQAEGGGVIVTVGPIQIVVRKPTPAEKRQGWVRVIEVEDGLGDEHVLLGDECGAAVPTDGDDEEAE